MLRESALPSGRFVQRPFDDGSAQLRQAPVHAWSQQTPSTQKFDAHSSLPLQACPGCLGPQLPFTQALPGWQSLSAVHGTLQLPLTQR